MTKITKECTTFSVLMLEKCYLHQNGVEFNFLFNGLASRPAISLRINPRIREDSKGVHLLQSLPVVVEDLLQGLGSFFTAKLTFLHPMMHDWNPHHMLTTRHCGDLSGAPLHSFFLMASCRKWWLAGTSNE